MESLSLPDAVKPRKQAHYDAGGDTKPTVSGSARRPAEGSTTPGTSRTTARLNEGASGSFVSSSKASGDMIQTTYDGVVARIALGMSTKDTIRPSQVGGQSPDIYHSSTRPSGKVTTVQASQASADLSLARQSAEQSRSHVGEQSHKSPYQVSLPSMA